MSDDRFMKIMVFFDLPIITKSQKKEYSRFRKCLINDGFIMLQYSVYCRTTRNNDDAKKHISRLRTFIPSEGSVRVLTITDKQYNSMELLVGDKLLEENYLDSRNILEL